MEEEALKAEAVVVAGSLVEGLPAVKVPVVRQEAPVRLHQKLYLFPNLLWAVKRLLSLMEVGRLNRLLSPLVSCLPAEPPAGRQEDRFLGRGGPLSCIFM